MFKFLKDKLKKAVSTFSRRAEEEAAEEQIGETEEKPEAVIKKGSEEAKSFSEIEKELAELKKEVKEELKEAEEKPKTEKKDEKRKKREEKKEIKEKKKEKKADEITLVRQLQEKIRQAQLKPPKEEIEKESIFKKITEKITTKKISEAQFEEFFWDLEVAMLENNVAAGIIEKIKEDLKQELVNIPIKRGKIQETIFLSLKKSIVGLFKEAKPDILKKLEKKKPYVICFVGTNGSGKTTTIAKIAHMLQKNGKSVVLAAADTFRAAAIDQLEHHANKLKTRIIKHDYGSDAAAVAFDAVKHAEAKKEDAVLIDTAGRMHNNKNLVDEMKKIVRVAKPDMVIFVGESITGNDCVEQAQRFNEAIGIDGIVLAKADVDEKGGAAISISYVTKKPIMYLGTGQEYRDLEEFDVKKILISIGLM